MDTAVEVDTEDSQQAPATVDEANGLPESPEEDNTPRQECEEQDSEDTPGWSTRLVRRFPRSYNLLLKVIIPLFILIFLCFLFGSALAAIESREEKNSNDQIISEFRDLMFHANQLVDHNEEACLSTFNGTLPNRTAVEEHMEQCVQEQSEDDEEHFNVLVQYFLDQEVSALTFHWMTCLEGNSSSLYAYRDIQEAIVINEWLTSYDKLRAEYQAEGMTPQEAHDLARDNATGSQHCLFNVAAGALFWFTIMTTIGYGNTAPITPGGQAMVYTAGFACILVFTALTGQAGYVCLTIVDDAFLRCRLDRLTKGLLSVLFWLCALGLWILVCAASFLGYARDRDSPEITLSETFWFSYITTTTVGLGDIHIEHDRFRAPDMFFIPLLLLIGFVFLANFLLKCSDFVLSCIPHTGLSLEDILKETRESSSEEEVSEGPPQPVEKNCDATRSIEGVHNKLSHNSTSGRSIE